MQYPSRKQKFKPTGEPSSFDPIFNADANASINQLFNGSSLFAPPAFFDNSQTSIPLAQNANLSQRVATRLKPHAPESLTLTLEYEGKEDKCIFKNQKADYD
jgi:hypothetical protein